MLAIVPLSLYAGKKMLRPRGAGELSTGAINGVVKNVNPNMSLHEGARHGQGAEVGPVWKDAGPGTLAFIL
jgi:hypothetical protein